MGYMRHHAIVLTCFNKESADIVRAKAGEIGLDPSPLHHSVVNGYWSFWCPPDGSKEGWSESDAGDARRSSFLQWLRNEGRERYADWAEVQYGDERGVALITAHSDEDRDT